MTVDSVLVWCYTVGGGGVMSDYVRITVALTPGIMEKLDKICAEKGIKRPSALSIAIEKLWKEEYADEK